MLKLEPTEAEAVRLPPLTVDPDLLHLVDEHVRAGDVSAAVDEVDRRVLADGLGLGDTEIALLRHGAEFLRTQRRERSGTSMKARAARGS